MSKIVTAKQAASMIGNGDNLLITGLISLLCPEKTIAAIEERFLETGEPNNLNVITPIRIGYDGVGGMERFAHKNMLKRHITGSLHPTEGVRIMKMLQNNEIEGYLWTMGIMFQWIRDIASGCAGTFTDVGIGTFIDPVNGGGKINERTTDDLIRKVAVDGNDYLHIRSIPMHTAIVMGTTADEDGNISFEGEGVKLMGIYMAAAAKNSGGKVIAQVKRVVKNGEIPPHQVVIPGILVDAIVVDENQAQTRRPYDPSLTGEKPKPREELRKHLPLDYKKVLLRRVAQELRKGDVVNLGVGVGIDLPYVLAEENADENITFYTEHGAIGGVPGDVGIFGAHYNPRAIVDSMFTFDYYHGGGLDATVLGIAQIDRFGNVNVSNFSGRLRGPGGLVDITHKTPRIFFIGTMTAGGLEEKIEDGKLFIVREGRVGKFLNDVEQITFNGPAAFARGQEVWYILERCVFRLREQGMILEEIAPGVDLGRDIQAHVPFTFTVAENLRTMDQKIFQQAPIGLQCARRR